jgi:hypothetical protein
MIKTEFQEIEYSGEINWIGPVEWATGGLM